MSPYISETEPTNENDHQQPQQTPTTFRTPLNAIPDPSQSDRKPAESLEPQLELSKPARFTPRSSRAHADLNTPVRRFSVSSSGSRRASSVYRGGRVGNVSAAEGVYAGVQHFELEENPAFWTDHNVQVLIRIRPLSSMERVSQGYGRCLKQESAQSLVWLGHPETRFTFDHVACETVSQEKLFKVAGVPMVENSMYGYNSCMFAYGQTGSGKTYTMMGEIHELEDVLTENCGITPRIFEYLFQRIREEEEKRKDEKLTYSCKCSFLEIYNEQITDLLEPSSTNLQLREDLKKGVYVENLTEYNVRTVNDVANLLLKGAANRKMAATHTNSESSRSHSVFTCIIESRCDKDSMTHFRFARLNLVDLAGSERQKCSGAEGDRLKEAANINKSLSTLGLVIMSLVDLAHGKHRHIPYRDSRLTFLLQDSLGGNSKTMIIANVSASMCSTNETLSTLKFAQRAKLIQNNAKVNEDSSGDVIALQQQIHQLKDQLSFLLKHHKPSRLLPSCIPSPDDSGLQDLFKDYDSSGGKKGSNNEIHFGEEKKIKGMESILIGSLRRERLADQALQKLLADIEQMNHLIGQKDEDARRTKLMLRFREDKIKRLESLLEGMLSSENYLVNENKALLEEMQLLKARTDRNPEVTQFALENRRLLEQLQLFQNFYEQGEREKLMAEVMELRNQLLDLLEGRCTGSARIPSQINYAQKELTDSKEMNYKLIREVDELRAELRKYINCSQPTTDSAETISIMSESGDEMSYNQANEASENKIDNLNGQLVSHTKESQNDLMDAKLVIEAMKSEQLRLIKELKLLVEENSKYKKILGDRDMVKERAHRESADNLYDKNQERISPKEDIGKFESKDLQDKFEKMTMELEELRLVNKQYKEDHASQITHQHQAEIVREQVELETARTIIHLQEEIAALQSELNERLHHLTHENARLREDIGNKEGDMRALREDWEKATLELTRFLLDSSRYLKDSYRHVDSIVGLFPHDNDSICQNVERAARACIEKEETILLLQRSLEDAQSMAADMKVKLSSLKEATIAINNFEWEDEDKQLNTLSNEKTNMVQTLEKRLKCRVEQVVKAEKRAYAAFLIVKWMYDMMASQPNEINVEAPHSEFLMQSIVVPSKETMINVQATVLQETETQVELSRAILLESLDAVEDTGRHVTSLQADICKAFSGCVGLVQKLVEIICNSNLGFDGIKDSVEPSPYDELQSIKTRDLLKYGNQLHQVRNELADINEKVMGVKDCINRRVYSHQPKAEDFLEADVWCADNYTSNSESSSESSSDTCNSPLIDLNLEGNFILQYDSYDPEKLTKHKEFLNHDMKEKLMTDPEMKLEKVEVCSKHAAETIGDEDGMVNSFFSRFMEAHATIKEADFMLNELMKANEKSTHRNTIWEQAIEKLMAERTTLIKQVAQLKSSLRSRERENQLLQEKIHSSSGGLVAALSSLEECFLKVQGVEGEFKVICSDVQLLGREILRISDKTGSLFEDIFSEFLAKEFTSFVIYQCHIEELIRKTESLMEQPGVHISQKLNCLSTSSNLSSIFINGKFNTMTSGQNFLAEFEDSDMVNNLKEQKPSNLHDNQNSEYLALQNELQRKEMLLQGLLFDFKMLQEAASNTKDIKDETEKLSLDLSLAQHEMEMKSSQLEDLLSQQKILRNCLTDTEEFLAKSNSELDQAKEEIFSLRDQNSEVRMLLKDFYLKNSEIEEQLEEKKQVVQSLEDEISNLTHALEKKTVMSVQNIEDDLQKVSCERDQLCEEVQSLTEKLEMALAIADENEAIAVEARQESEEIKARAEQKEEEVKVLERSVEELECTINMLEKKVHEMEAEVERNRFTRDSSNEELQAWQQRLSTMENLEGKFEQADGIFWKQQQETLVELHGVRTRMKHLEEENAEYKQEIKQCKEYISELLLHAEAQASQYQCKYKGLEAMFHGVKTDAANQTASAATLNKVEKSSVRIRGSSSPFKCISNLVQQMNLEKDQELSMARLRIEDLEALAASRQKEICMLNTRLAAAESMTHDVIRDLLGIKLDMTNYANLIDQQQFQKLVEAAHHYTEELLAKEQDIQLLRKQVDGLIDERKSYRSDVDRREADLLAAQVTLEQLRERDQLLYAQNEMLKRDKTNLKRRVAELDEMVKTLLGTPSTQSRQISAKKGNGSLNVDVELARRSTQSERLLPLVNEELAHYSNPSGSYYHENTGRPAWK